MFFLILFSSEIFFIFSANIDRSIIRKPDINNQACENRMSSNPIVQMRTADILSSIEYRELQKKNNDLLAQVENLKDALKQKRKQLKRMEKTHICKLSLRHHRHD